LSLGGLFCGARFDLEQTVLIVMAMVIVALSVALVVVLWRRMTVH